MEPHRQPAMMMYPQGLSAMESSRAIVNEPPGGGRQTHVRQELQALENVVERLEGLAMKLQPLISQGPMPVNGQAGGADVSQLAPLAQEIHVLGSKVADVVRLLERVEL